jgi:hypothetical protein
MSISRRLVVVFEVPDVMASLSGHEDSSSNIICGMSRMSVRPSLGPPS